jgi:eukaryotic-like serine/threonine-protein kinase
MPTSGLSPEVTRRRYSHPLSAAIDAAPEGNLGLVVTLPSRIGKYRVVAQLGQGGMSRVLLCLASGVADFTKLLVVKQLKDELAGDPEFLTMFLDEARLAARLNHPNVVQTYEVGEEDGSYFIAMDYLEGQSLHAVVQRARRGDMPLDIHLRVLSDMLSGLHYAHELRDYDGSPLSVVHRDVSPHNVFVTYDGQVKLVDFGIAKAAGAAGMTQEGVFKGKVNYIAPEQALGEKVDRRADIFAAGVMLWEAVARKRIARGQTDLVTLNLRLHGDDPRLRDVASDAPVALVELCERAMAHHRDDRIETAEAFRDALDAYLDAHGRVGTKDVARFLERHFARDRAALRATVEEQVKLHAGADEPRPIVTLVTSPLRARASGARPSGAHEPTPTKLSVDHEEAPVPARSWSPRLAGAGLAIAAGALVAVLASRGGEETVPAAVASTVAASATPRDERVSIELSVEPKDALVTLDGAAVASNPFRAKVPADGQTHRIAIRAEGYEPVERIVTFDRDISLSVSLVRVPAAASASARAATAPARARPAPRPSDSTDARPPTRPIDEKVPF